MGDTGRTVDVGGYDEQIGSIKDVSIVHAALAHDCPDTNKTYLLVFHEALHIPDMTMHLLNPMQMRDLSFTSI